MATKAQKTKTDASAKAAAPCKTKISNVIALLKRKQGATLHQIVKATGWQPHTTRAAMTGLKKKGYAIQRDTSDGGSLYRITGNS